MEMQNTQKEYKTSETTVSSCQYQYYDYVKDDPCHGCKFAVLKTEEQMIRDGMFARRYLCINMRRRDELELEVTRKVAAKDYAEAHRLICKLMQLPYRENPLFNVVSDELFPHCYTSKWEREKEKATMGNSGDTEGRIRRDWAVWQ